MRSRKTLPPELGTCTASCTTCASLRPRPAAGRVSRVRAARSSTGSRKPIRFLKLPGIAPSRDPWGTSMRKRRTSYQTELASASVADIKRIAHELLAAITVLEHEIGPRVLTPDDFPETPRPKKSGFGNLCC